MDDVRTLTEAKALAALAHPSRARMMDSLAVDGPSTASALAARTDQAVGSASHHLKVMAEAGLVVEAPELAQDRRERWWRLATPGTRWSKAELRDDPAAYASAREAEMLQIRRQLARVEDWLARSAEAPEWEETAFATQTWLTLSPAELEEVAEEVMAVYARWRRREIPDDGAERESVLVYARGFPTRP